MSYPGGKSGCGVYHRLAREIPPHDERIVPFLGRCAIMRNVRPAKINIGIEIDAEVLDQWSADELQRFDLRLGDGVDFLLWRFALNRWPATATSLSPLQALAAVYGGGRPVPFIFADPPYPAATCTSGCPYRVGFSDEQHATLLATLKLVPALVMIVSYPNELYERELAGWRTFKYRAFTRRGTRTEQAWCNYPAPRVLHDSRFAGRNRREREKLARRGRNWRRNYIKHPPAERAAILAELVEAEHQAGRFASMLAHVCTRCLTTNPPDVVECSVCRCASLRPVLRPVFDDPCLQPQPLQPSTRSAAPPRKAAAAAKRKAK